MLLRCPGFDHAGLPEGEAGCECKLNLLAGNAAIVAVYVIVWPQAERRLVFDLLTPRRRFFSLAEQTAGKVAVTCAPEGTIPRVEELLRLDLPIGDETFRRTLAVADEIERTPSLQKPQ